MEEEEREMEREREKGRRLIGEEQDGTRITCNGF